MPKPIPQLRLPVLDATALVLEARRVALISLLRVGDALSEPAAEPRVDAAGIDKNEENH